MQEIKRKREEQRLNAINEEIEREQINRGIQEQQEIREKELCEREKKFFEGFDENQIWTCALEARIEEARLSWEQRKLSKMADVAYALGLTTCTGSCYPEESCRCPPPPTPPKRFR
jgi:hypothetical protein